MINIYRITVNDAAEMNEVYSGFIVTAPNINSALEIIYSTIIGKGNDIPYYLRSSNMKIENIGVMQNCDKKYENCVLLSSYLN